MNKQSVQNEIRKEQDHRQLLTSCPLKALKNSMQFKQQILMVLLKDI